MSTDHERIACKKIGFLFVHIAVMPKEESVIEEVWCKGDPSVSFADSSLYAREPRALPRQMIL